MIQMKKVLSSLKEGKEEFIADCKIRNLANGTISLYEEHFNYFIKYINENYPQMQVATELTKDIINEFIIDMRENGLKITTINIRLRSIRCFIHYFVRNGYIENEFIIEQLKEEKGIPQLYTREEIRTLLKKPNLKTCSFAEYRTWAIINFFVATGVRRRSLINIKIGDLDFDNDIIYVRVTKNRKTIIIPMGKALKKVLLEYLKYRNGESDDYLFCNLEGMQLTENALNNLIKKYNTKRGVKKTGVHLFRHYFAKEYIQNGGNALKLQKLLGHSTLEQTQIYVDLFGEDLQADFDKYNPLDRLCMNNERIKMRV